MFLRVTTKPPLERRRRANLDFTRAPRVVEVDDITARMIRDDASLVVRELSEADASAWTAREAAAKAAADRAKSTGETDDFGPDVEDDGRGGVAQQQLRHETDRRIAAELEVARMRKLLADSNVTDPLGEDNARKRGVDADGHDVAPGGESEDDDGDEPEATPKPASNDGGPQRLRPPNRRRNG